MRTNILKSAITVAFLGASCMTIAATDSPKPAVSDEPGPAQKAGTKIDNAAGVTKDAAVDTGKAVKHGAEAAGHKTKNAAEVVGHEVKKDAGAVGHEVKKDAEAVGHKTKEVTVDTKKKAEKAVKNNTATEGEVHGSPSN
jgi:hypothetical protein